MKLLQIKTTFPDLWLVFSLVIYVFLNIPFFGNIPYLDGNIDFIKTHDFFSGGFTNLLQNWNSVHPPGKEFITFPFFVLLGVNRYSYTLIGPLFGVIGIVFFYLLTLKTFGKTPARIASFLLAINPLFLSVGIFSLTDFLLVVFAIGSFYFYLSRKNLLLSIFLSLSFLVKETGLIIPISMIAIEFISIKKLRTFTTFLLALFTPFLIAYTWYSFLKIQDKPLWSDWNFSETASQGSVYTVFHNLITFSFLNKFALQNWLHLFILNFNWVYWLISVIGLIHILSRFKGKKIRFLINMQSGKTLLSITIFFFLYSLTVLSFQTYTIPRYTLPLIIFPLLGISESLYIFSKYHKIRIAILLIPVILITGFSLFFSLDPISIAFWGREKVLGEEIYAIRKKLAGSDGITYNMQYAIISKKRTNQIFIAESEGVVISNDCYWIFPDPRNDIKTSEILNLKINFVKPCINLSI